MPPEKTTQVWAGGKNPPSLFEIVPKLGWLPNSAQSHGNPIKATTNKIMGKALLTIF